MIDVVLVDDHIIVRSGFAQLLSLEPDIQVVGEFGSVKETRLGLPRLKPNVCIIDISMPDESGLDLLKDIPSTIHCIMLSVNDSEVIVKKALELGAKGYLSKRCSPDELIQAVRTVYAGGVYLMPELTIKLVAAKQQNHFFQLTKREQEICEMLVSGLDAKEIAEKLNLSFKTVHVHRANAMSKLNVKNNVELANLFNQQKL
ncbi:transcriptional regulator [Gallibacterium salpingitidis]|uniref:Transcriptional regulatory protein UhpA n=1 Tax=Gallibacterium salpingitidis TaxID=505341 RepID=A0A1A7Q489_9PAST|nr:transcriptional regulator UhpA [Gallibacterium salpingitidis]OBW91208.1 transcriptional regulator [Gallibacterium salpingitidis]OBX08230.1 transcriptional regulator [Gallibacterium salpingitidis]OBX09748.1 transcriptional regulator [Gallibacterium salpingitidis]WKT00319.1 transcriptional regulator UhpA [Gallibacterium salpingitidis]